jgi:hypothetical protein
VQAIVALAAVAMASIFISGLFCAPRLLRRCRLLRAGEIDQVASQQQTYYWQPEEPFFQAHLLHQ